MNSPLLNTLEDLLKRAESGKGLDAVRRVVNSPVVAMIVRLTPNPVDDAVLGLLQTLLPATPSAS